jgi:hypothetical protein
MRRGSNKITEYHKNIREMKIMKEISSKDEKNKLSDSQGGSKGGSIIRKVLRSLKIFQSNK